MTLKASSRASLATGYLGILCQGPSAKDFLQGQLSCDIQAIGLNFALPGARCNTLGRVLASVLAIDFAGSKIESAVLLICAADQRDALKQDLGRYLLNKKAVLSDFKGTIGCSLAAAKEPRELPASPLTYRVVKGQRGASEIYLPSGRGLQRLLLVKSQQGESKKAEATGVSEVFWQCWLECQIASGVAEIGQKASGLHCPQDLNYQLTGHLSFTKGCYLGQEIVARMHYRGKAKKALYRASCSFVAQAGQKLTKNGKPVGQVVESIGLKPPYQDLPAGEKVLLTVLEKSRPGDWESYCLCVLQKSLAAFGQASLDQGQLSIATT